MANRTLNVKITGDPRSLNRALGQSQTRIATFARSVDASSKSLKGLALARSGPVAAVAAIGLGFNKAAGSAVEFEREMRNVNSIAKLSERDLGSLSDQVRGLAPEVGKGPAELAAGLYDVVSSGFTASEAIGVLEAASKAATAGLTDTATASRAVSAVLNAYNLEATEARKVSDLLFQEVNLGVNTFEDLANNLGDVVPQAAALKVPFEQVAAALATITLGGTNIAEASTQLGRVLAQFVKPSKELGEQFRKMGFESGQAAVETLGFAGVVQRLSEEAGGNQQIIAKWLGDIRGIRGVLNLTGQNLGTFQQKLREMGDATEGTGATQKAFGEQSKSLSFQLDKLKASASAAATGFGNEMLPAIKTGVSVMQSFADDTNRAALSAEQLAKQGEKIADVFGAAGIALLKAADAELELQKAQAIRAPGEGRANPSARPATQGGNPGVRGTVATAPPPSLVTQLPNRLVQNLLDAQIEGSDKSILAAFQDQAKFLRTTLAQKGLTRQQRTDLKTDLISVQGSIESISDAIDATVRDKNAALKDAAKDLARQREDQADKARKLQEDIKRATSDALGARVERLDLIQSGRDIARRVRDARENLQKQLRIGGTVGIRSAREELQDAQLARRRLRLQGVTFAGSTAPGTTIGNVRIEINSNQDPVQIANEVLARLRKKANQTSTQTRGRRPAVFYGGA